MHSYIETVRQPVLEWLESVRYLDEGWGRWKYHAAMERPYALQASAIAIRILSELGALDDITSRLKAEAIDFFQSCQDPDDLLLKDPLENEENHEGPHTWDNIWGQRNGAGLEALSLLGAAPKLGVAPHQFVDLSRQDGREWMMQLDWTNPWRDGETWSRAIQAFLKTQPHQERSDSHPVLSPMFHAMESQILDPATGYPTLGGYQNDLPCGMAGLFKVMVAYLFTGRPVPHAHAAIDSTLALQRPDGEFGYRRNMCMNWDSLWVLYYLDKQIAGAYRHDDIVSAGNRTARMLLETYRKPDGAFAFHGEHCQTNHHSIRLNREPLPISDMLGTTMCLKCLFYADEWNDAGIQAPADNL